MPFVAFKTRAFAANRNLQEMSPAQLIAFDAPDGSLVRQISPQFTGPLVRRPISGIALKERTPANITVVKADGTPVLLHNALGGTRMPVSHYQGLSGASTTATTSAYTDFTILQMQESRQEKFQIVETFGEDFVFFYGDKPMFLQVAGVLVNSIDFNWRAEWWENYDKYLRGTKCVEMRARVHLNWDDVLVQGYIVQANASDSAFEPHQVPFGFTMLVTEYTSLAALQFSQMRQFADAREGGPPAQDEWLGSRAADVRSSGQQVEIGDDFWRKQLSAIFDLDNPDQAVNALIQQGPEAFLADQKQATFMPYLKAGGPATAALDRNLPFDGPLKHLLVRSVPGGTETALGHGDLFSDGSLAKREGAKKLLGQRYEAQYTLTKIGTGIATGR